MKRLTLILLLTALLWGCGGDDGGGAPDSIAGSWYGTGYISGHYVELTTTFHDQGGGYYGAVQVFASPGYGVQSQETVIYYESGIVYAGSGIWATVKGDCMTISVEMEIAAGGVGAIGHIDSYRQ